MEYGGTTNLKKFIKAHKDKNQLIEEEIIEYTDHEKVLMEKFSTSAWTKMFIQVEQEKSM